MIVEWYQQDAANDSKVVPAGCKDGDTVDLALCSSKEVPYQRVCILLLVRMIVRWTFCMERATCAVGCKCNVQRDSTVKSLLMLTQYNCL